MAVSVKFDTLFPTWKSQSFSRTGFSDQNCRFSSWQHPHKNLLDILCMQGGFFTCKKPLTASRQFTRKTRFTG